MDGCDPELIIQLDDNQLNLDKYQQIIHKVYSVIRFRVYHEIQKKIRAQAKQKSNPNDSMLSANSFAIPEDEYVDLVRGLDLDQINKDVFNLYNISYGLDTTLALRKVQVIEANDQDFSNYLECLKQAHDYFLAQIFQGQVFNKMQQNPLHSTDLQYGVPWEFNQIVDELLDPEATLIN